MEIKNKIVIITGASQGIGLATARLLSQKGAKVVLVARTEKDLKKLEKEIHNSFAVVADIRKRSDVKNMVTQTIKKYGRVDVLINNAGQGMYGPVHEIDIEDYKKVMDLNVFGALNAMQEVIPCMKKQKSGVIINISSRLSKMYLPNMAAYSSTKYALNALSVIARQELKGDNITVSTVYPKMTATKFGENSLSKRPQFGSNSRGPTPEIDSAEKVAEKIYELIESGAEEIVL